MAAALLVFIFTVVKSLSKRYDVYFSRSLVSTAFLLSLKPSTHSKVIHQALSVPLPSKEVFYMPHGGFESIIRYYIFRFLEKNILPRADGITVASEEYADILVEIGVKRDKVWVVPFSVEKAFFEQPIKEDASEVFTFCYVGRFHLYHVLVPLVQAFGFLTQSEVKAELLLVGEGVLRPEVEKEVTERKLSDKIKFIGMISKAELPPFLSAVDCFVLLSQAPGMPIGLLEAAAAGKPILTLRRTHDKTLDSYFEHGKEIYMVENSSPKRIAQAFDELYANSKLRQSLAYGARKVAKQYFSEEATIGKIRKLIKRLQLNKVIC
jgi:glycosyltransferase involved in cell wall biosynthesis